jgi:hypothetical protein
MSKRFKRLSALALAAAAVLTGCVVVPAYPGYGYGHGYRHGYGYGYGRVVPPPPVYVVPAPPPGYYGRR